MTMMLRDNASNVIEACHDQTMIPETNSQK